jgi:hypothetical protein
VKPRRPVPPPEPVKPVPQKYLVLKGDHPDHPGEGRGSRAIQRTSAQSESSLRGASRIAHEDCGVRKHGELMISCDGPA